MLHSVQGQSYATGTVEALCLHDLLYDKLAPAETAVVRGAKAKKGAGILRQGCSVLSGSAPFRC